MYKLETALVSFTTLTFGTTYRAAFYPTSSVVSDNFFFLFFFNIIVNIEGNIQKLRGMNRPVRNDEEKLDREMKIWTKNYL